MCLSIDKKASHTESTRGLQAIYSSAIYNAKTQPLESIIFGDARFTTTARVDVYRNNTLGSLKKSLSSVYPVTKALVGEHYFNQLTSLYVQQHPSVSRNLDHYGEYFPLLLKELIVEREELKPLAYLADVAQLEQRLHHSYYAKDRSFFHIDGFSKLSAEQQLQVRFMLADDITLLESHFPIVEIWQSHQDDDTMNWGITDEACTYYCLVQRQQWKPTAITINKDFFDLLTLIQTGSSLLELTSYLDENPVEFVGSKAKGIATKGIAKNMDISTLIQQHIIIGYEIE